MNIKKISLLFFNTIIFLCLTTQEVVSNVHARRLARHTRHKKQSANILSTIDAQSDDALVNNQYFDTEPQSGSKNETDYQNKNNQAAQSIEQAADLAENKHLIGTIPSQEASLPEEISGQGLINDQSEEDTIEFNFENAGLDQLIKQIESIFNITFIASDVLNPDPQKLNVSAFKISFKTHKPLSKSEAWSLFLSFLDMSGFMTIPDKDAPTINDMKVPSTEASQTTIYKIVPLNKAVQEPLPTFIGLDYRLLPKNDQIIRYIYFLENSTTASLASIVDNLKSSSGKAIALQEHNAFLFIDKTYNIRQLMKIITELDKVTMPQTMSVLKLRRADASEVKKLYETLIQSEEKNGLPARLFPQKKSSSSSYFPEVKIVAERVSNSLILLGPTKAIKKIENFIIEYIDTEIKKPYAPFFTYQLKYADASTVANIMNEVTKFGEDSEAGKLIRSAGGVRGGDKFLKPMLFIPEKETNQLVVKGDYGDFLMAKEVIEQLDQPQPQIGVEVFVLALNLTEARILGSQLRSREPCGTNGLLGNDIKFQTSGLRTGPGNLQRGFVENPNGNGIQRLLGDLINLATTAEAGNTLISLGDQLGVWAIVQALQTMNSTQVISNPFLLLTNKTEGRVSIGETRRIVQSNIVNNTTNQSFETFGDNSANLVVNVTPIINSDGMIVLGLNITLDNFIGQLSTTNVRKNTRNIKTEVIVANKEVIALGGVIENTIEDDRTKVPLLGDIPLIGWLFKNKRKNEDRDSLLILISSTIIDAIPSTKFNAFTQKRINDYENGTADIKNASQWQDPINRWFFRDSPQGIDYIFDRFTQNGTTTPEKIAQSTDNKATRKNRRNRKLKKPTETEQEPFILSRTVEPANQNPIHTDSQPLNDNASKNRLPASPQKHSLSQFFKTEDEVMS